MQDRTRERALWAICALAGLSAFVLGLLPGFRVHIAAGAGDGDSQQAFDYDRTWSLAGYATPWSIAVLVGAVAVVAVALYAIFRNHTGAALIAVATLALAGSAITASAGWVEVEGGVESCDSWSDCGGAFLNPAVRELRREALSRPEARRPGYNIEPGYSARALVSWNLIELVAHGLFLVAGFLAFRSSPLLTRAGPVFPFLAIATMTATASGVDCSEGFASSQGALEGIAFYPLAVAALAGVAALMAQRWKLGLLTLGLTLVIGAYVFIGVAFHCYE